MALTVNTVSPATARRTLPLLMKLDFPVNNCPTWYSGIEVQEQFFLAATSIAQSYAQDVILDNPHPESRLTTWSNDSHTASRSRRVIVDRPVQRSDSSRSLWHQSISVKSHL